MRIKELFFKYREVVLYLFFGGCTTLVNIGAYFVLDVMGISTAFSTVMAWLLSVLFAFITNKIFVFSSRSSGHRGIFKEGFSFFSCRFLTGVLDLVIMLLFVDKLGLNGLLIKVLSNILVIALNYVFSKLFIFKGSK